MKNLQKEVDCFLKEIQSIDDPEKVMKAIEASKIISKIVLDAASMYAADCITEEQIKEVARDNYKDQYEDIMPLVIEYVNAVGAYICMQDPY